ncbi:CAP domain-containing protein [Luteolibacter luteus]|uniref:CAP domain-containing protein n=1 Tax=Luteolibacter luteus TaxID=2728835 RepID=A0A858RDN4_9BACT|nr:CAP domain-containing protein [Luteolibacter luteus]QJE94825.1 CAP domain-containing protein [Luteolibacter luteus]
MKITPSRLWVVAAGATMLASCGPQLSTTTVPMASHASVSKSDGSLVGNIYSQVNSFRASNGRSELKRHAGLDRMAQQHCEFMRQNRGKFGKSNLTHYGFEERAMAAQRMMKMSNVGENIGTCSGSAGNSAAVLVNAWKNSSGHMKNMKGSWNATGIGAVVDSDGTVFATQIFASEDHSHMSLTNRMRAF